MIPMRKTCSVLALAIFAAAMSADALAAKKLLRLKFDAAVLESPSPESSLMALFGQDEAKTLREWVNEIEKATKDSNIAGAVMVIESPSFSLAQVEELTRALKGFRDKGKKVYCYTDSASNGTYALACAADHITLAENSSLDIIGLHAELDFYKGLLDKIGVEMDMLHCGAYKAALEPYTRTEPSKEFAENINWLLNGIYDRWTQLLSDGRKQSLDQIKEAIDNAPLEAADALKRKLVDSVGSWGDFRQMLQKEYGKDVQIVKKYGGKEKLDLDFSNPFAIFTMFNEMMEKAQAKSEKAGIGLVYIEGGINTGKSAQGMFGGGTSAGSTTIRAALERAAEDDNLKAVVLRVDSPGGSAVASDIIWKAATHVAKTKPLIVSMGAVAGSGGYYVAIPGDTIFAEESTITGSIGVVGGKMVWKGLMEDKLGITTTEFGRGKRAGIMSSNRKWTDDERKWMTDYMNNTYEQFKGRIKSSRGDRIKGDLEALAGGRVYTGRQALEKGLIDKIGGLEDAIRFAANKVGLSDPEVYVLPKQKDLGDILAAITGQETEDEYEVSRAPGGKVSLKTDGAEQLFGAATPALRELAPDRLMTVAQALRQLLVLDREKVSCFMPSVPRIR